MEFANGIYTDYDAPELNDYNYDQIEFKITPTFSRIVLCDEYSIPSIIIESSELEILSRRNEDDYDIARNVTAKEIYQIFNKIKRLLKKLR